MLEVGPGTGNLTRFLLETGALVTAVEKDRRLIQSLSKELPQASLLSYYLAAHRGRMLAFDKYATAGSHHRSRHFDP